jgi:ribosome modulation factor
LGLLVKLNEPLMRNVFQKGDVLPNITPLGYLPGISGRTRPSCKYKWGRFIA